MAKEVFSIRMDRSLVDNLDSMAAETGNGCSRNALVEWASEWYVKLYTAHGFRPLTKSDMDDLMEYIRSRAQPGKASSQSKDAAGSDGGGVPQPVDPRNTGTPVKSQKPSRRKSTG